MTKKVEFEETKHITVAKASELLNKTPHCVRQLMFRKKIQTHSVNGRIYLDFDDVLTYQSRKKGIPSWEANISKLKHKSFISLEYAAQELMVQVSYVTKLIKNGTLEGYVASSGEVLITKESINKYLGNAIHASASDL